MSEQRWRRFQSINGGEITATPRRVAFSVPQTEDSNSFQAVRTPAKYFSAVSECNVTAAQENTPITGIQQRTPRQSLHSVSTTPGKTPLLVRTPLPLKALQLANFQTPDSVRVSDGESSLDIEELEEVQDLLAEKDEELAELRERVDRLESRRGAKQQLKALDAKTAELKAQMAEKQRQIDMLKGRRPKRRPILPIIASGLAVCERRAAEEAGKLALRALRAFNLKPVSPITPETPQAHTPLSSQGDTKSPFFFSPWSFPPINLAKVQKGCYVVMAECHASCTLAFSLAGEQLWMGRVEHRGEESLKLHYFQQLAGQPGVAMAFEPCVDARGYPLIGTEPLTQRSLVVVFDELDRPMRGGAGQLPEAAAEEVLKRLRGRSICSSTDENSPSLAGWASP
ncbi:g4196 [Coccomyxa elongata]